MRSRRRSQRQRERSRADLHTRRMSTEEFRSTRRLFRKSRPRADRREELTRQSTHWPRWLTSWPPGTTSVSDFASSGLKSNSETVGVTVAPKSLQMSDEAETPDNA